MLSVPPLVLELPMLSKQQFVEVDANATVPILLLSEEAQTQFFCDAGADALRANVPDGFVTSK